MNILGKKPEASTPPSKPAAEYDNDQILQIAWGLLSREGYTLEDIPVKYFKELYECNLKLFSETRAVEQEKLMTQQTAILKAARVHKLTMPSASRSSNTVSVPTAESRVFYPKEQMQTLLSLNEKYGMPVKEYSAKFVPLHTLKKDLPKLNDFHRLIYREVLRPNESIAEHASISFFHGYSSQHWAPWYLLRKHQGRLTSILHDLMQDNDLYKPEKQAQLHFINEFLHHCLRELFKDLKWLRIPRTLAMNMIPSKENLFSELIKITSEGVEVLSRSVIIAVHKEELAAAEAKAEEIRKKEKAEIEAKAEEINKKNLADADARDEEVLKNERAKLMTTNRQLNNPSGNVGVAQRDSFFGHSETKVSSETPSATLTAAGH